MLQGRKMYDETTQFSRDHALQLLLDSLLAACGNLMTLTKHIECLDGAAARDLRTISENSVGYMPVLYTSG